MAQILRGALEPVTTSELDAAFADDGKDIQEMSKAEKFPHTLANIEEL